MSEPESDRKPVDERPVLKHFSSRIKSAASHCRKVWDEAEENQKFSGGGSHQWNGKDYDTRIRSGRPAFSFNDAALATRAMSGREMTARFEPTYLARSAEDGQWCEILRDATKKIRQRADAQNSESHAFMDLARDNVSVVEWEQVFDGTEVRGRTVCEHRPIWEYMWDPRAMKAGLTDREWDARGYHVSIDEFLMMFPGERDAARERLNTHRDGWVERDTEVAYRHPWQQLAEKGQYIRRDNQTIFLANYIWREREGAYTADVPIGIGPHPIGPEEWARISQALGLPPAPLLIPDEEREQYRQLFLQAVTQGAITIQEAEMLRPYLKKMRLEEFEPFMEEYGQAFGEDPAYAGPQDNNYLWVWKRAVMYGERVIREHVLPFHNLAKTGCGSPRIFMAAVPITSPEGVKFQSVIEMMKDPQKFKNFIISLATSHLMRSTKSGMISKKGTFSDPSAVETELAKPFWHIEVNSAVQSISDSIMMVDGTGFPAGLDRFLDMADQASWRPTGMNPNTLGNLQDPRRVSGTVFDALSDAVMTVLSWEFNAFSGLRRASGALLLDFIREYYEPDDLRDIVGPTRGMNVPEKARWAEMLDRDVMVEEVPVTKSEKERAWEMSSRQGSIDKWVESGFAPPWLIPKMYPDTWISEEDRQKWLQWLDTKGMGLNSITQPPPAEAGADPNAQPPGSEEPVQ